MLYCRDCIRICSSRWHNLHKQRPDHQTGPAFQEWVQASNQPWSVRAHEHRYLYPPQVNGFQQNNLEEYNTSTIQINLPLSWKIHNPFFHILLYFCCVYSILYIGLQLNDELTTPTQSSSLTDRVVQLSLDGKEKVTLVSSQYKLKAMALDDAGKETRPSLAVV